MIILGFISLSTIQNIFGPHEQSEFCFNEKLTEDVSQVTEQENELLTAAFTEKEIKDDVFHMEHNKVPGPDGFSAEFYQFFWKIIKEDLLELFNAFHSGDLPIESLNFGLITVLPKKSDATCIQ